jgi:hypothetical protein
MNSRLGLNGLAVIGIFVAFAATEAQAGGAAGSASFDTFFECQTISGSNVGAVVSTYDFTDTVVNGNVRVGQAVLACRQVNLKDSAGEPINPAPGDQLKCYSVNAKGSQGVPQAAAFSDAFFPGGETVHMSQPLRYLCGPAIPIFVP